MINYHWHRFQRLKVLSVRGSLSTAVVPQHGNTGPINRVDQQTGILYQGRLVATSESHSIFDLFTNVMNYHDWRLFLGSNGEHSCFRDQKPNIHRRTWQRIRRTWVICSWLSTTDWFTPETNGGWYKAQFVRKQVSHLSFAWWLGLGP